MDKVNESILSETILEDMKENRIDHMTYLEGMEVLDSDNGCRDTILAVSLEIDDSVFSSGTATTMSNGDLTLVVTASILL